MKTEFDKIKDNNFFWLFYISAAFCNAYDDETETSLSEFISENYDNEESLKWSVDFVKYTDDDTEISDDPNIITLNLNGYDFSIEFQPFEIVYYLNKKKIANTGGHFMLRALSWNDFSRMIINISDGRIPLLIIPVLALDTEHLHDAEKIIRDGINMLFFDKSHEDIITDMIIGGLLE